MLNKEYIASSGEVYTDGNQKQNIDKEGFVHIELSDAQYIVLFDINNQLYLEIYKYTPVFTINNLISEVIKIKKNYSNIGYNKKFDNLNIIKESDLVNINSFVCPKCGKEFVKAKSKADPSLILAYCSNCNIEYFLKPSKYFVIVAKKQFFRSKNNLLNEELMPEIIVKNGGSKTNER